MNDEKLKNANGHLPQQGIAFAQIKSAEMHQANAPGLSLSQ